MVEVHVNPGTSNYQTRLLAVVTDFAKENDGVWLMTAGKGDAYRQVPLNSACRWAFGQWGSARADQVAAASDDRPTVVTGALWLSRVGAG